VQQVGFDSLGMWFSCMENFFYIKMYKCNIWHENINSQLDATIIILLITSISSTCFGRWYRPSSGALDCVYSLWYETPTMLSAGDQDEAEPHPGHQQAASSVLYTTSFKHSLVLLRMDEIIARNMLSWLKLLIKLLSLRVVDCLYYCINDARSHKYLTLIAYIWRYYKSGM